MLSNFIDRKTVLNYFLLPLAWLFALLVMVRRCCYLWGIFKVTHFNVPVVIVGNISVGGTGKTPLVIYLVKLLIQHGYSPGVVSRGYGGKSQYYPRTVTIESSPAEVGDEPVLIAQKTGVPVVVAPDRVAAVKYLLEHTGCDIVIADDGLQHYALGRSLEIAVIDGKRGFGNGFYLPAGPLRESQARLQKVDFVLCNSNLQAIPSLVPDYFELVPDRCIRNLKNSHEFKDLNECSVNEIHAVAGIGHPERFFETLRHLGLKFKTHAFKDHYQFQVKDLNFGENALIIMTEKDAVKCKTFANAQYWSLGTTCRVRGDFEERFLRQIHTIHPRD